MSEANKVTNQEKRETQEKKEEKRVAKITGIPMMASIEDVITAIKVLSDKGGAAKIGDLVEVFGGKKKERLLSSALGAAEEFGLIEPRKERSPYLLSDEGKKFLSASIIDEQKNIILPHFMRYKGYRDIFIKMRNDPDKTIKKETITAAWMSIIGGGKESARRLYTATFASVGNWSGAIKDTGKSCALTPIGEKVLSQILKGEEIKVEKPPVPPLGGAVPPPPSIIQMGPSLQISNCPYCGKQEIAIENEELLSTLSTDGQHTLIIKYTLFCRGCSRTFSRIGQQIVK